MSNPDPADVDDPEEDVIDLEDESDAEEDEVQPPPTSSGRRFSGIYIHFEDSKDPKYAICKHCKKKVSLEFLNCC